MLGFTLTTGLLVMALVANLFTGDLLWFLFHALVLGSACVMRYGNS